MDPFRAKEPGRNVPNTPDRKEPGRNVPVRTEDDFYGGERARTERPREQRARTERPREHRR